MPLHSTVLPQENISTRELILRKIQSFGTEPFTIEQIRKLTRPRLKTETIRYHLDDLINNLWLRTLPRTKREPILYQWHDGVKELDNWLTEEDTASEYLKELRRIAYHLRTGQTIHPDSLDNLRAQLLERIERLEREVDYMSILHDCGDLWKLSTLVNRLGFSEGE